MSTSITYDLAIIGGGIVGCSTAMALSAACPGLKIALFEKESQLAQHQTGHNSGVIHAGLYYKPGSLKAQTCTNGREQLYNFCAEHGIAHERCGKVVVAVTEVELSALEELQRRGVANGLNGLERLDAEGLRRHEPNVQGVAGLFVPQTGIVDYVAVTRKMAEVARSRGLALHLGHRITGLAREGQLCRIEVGGSRFAARYVVNCAGLFSDRVARLAGVEPGLRIIPFRGEYYVLRPERRDLVRNLIYPVPDATMPFLGVHFTRMIDGGVEAGPNAVLALKREGYRRTDVSAADLLDTFAFPGFWRLAGRFWKVGAYEYGRSFSRRLFLHSLQRLLPAVGNHDIVPGGSGVRAQAVDRDGKLVDDFRIVAEESMVHVLNAPSPAATASISIGEHIAAEVQRMMER